MGSGKTGQEWWPHHFASKTGPAYASRKFAREGASVNLSRVARPTLTWSQPEAGARPNDGNGSSLIGRVGAVPENIRAASHDGIESVAVHRNRPKPITNR